MDLYRQSSPSPMPRVFKEHDTDSREKHFEGFIFFYEQLLPEWSYQLLQSFRRCTSMY
jgi:hypothetical protein